MESARTAIARQSELFDSSPIDHRLEFALKAANMYVWERDLNSRNVERFGDPAAVLGISGDTIDEFLAHVHPDDRERVSRSIEDVLNHCRPYELEFRMIRADGRTIWVYDSGKRIATPSGERFLGVCMDISREVEARQTIAHLALHDGLTSLPNRTQLRERLDELTHSTRRTTQPLAVVAFDLDGFKRINDTLGHRGGDAALVEFSAIFRSVFANTDLLSRVGGDEFVALCLNADRSDLEALARQLQEKLRKPLSLHGQEVFVGVSIGAAFCGQDSLDTESLLHCADLALYEAKAARNGEISFYRAGMGAKAQRRRLLERDLRRALELGELSLLYQPLISGATGCMDGVEALMRWKHPEFGSVQPDEFIAIAETTGLIIPMGNWALRTACEAARQWPSLYTAVNVSAAQFRQPEFTTVLATCLASSGINPARLELEVTETVLLSNVEHTRDTFNRVKAMGVTIAMDDFGSGYSSLSYISSFAFDKIKIDGSFVRQLGTSSEAATVVRAVLSLGNSLGVRTTAECVETTDQMDFLNANGCNQLQGFLFSPAVSEEAIMVRLAQENRIGKDLPA